MSLSRLSTVAGLAGSLLASIPGGASGQGGAGQGGSGSRSSIEAAFDAVRSDPRVARALGDLQAAGHG